MSASVKVLFTILLYIVYCTWGRKYPLMIKRELWFSQLNDTKISAAIKYSLQDIYCAQIITDRSLFATKILTSVHDSPYASTIVSSDYMKKIRCNINIIAAETRGNLIKLLRNNTPSTQTVLLFFCAKDYKELHYFLQEERKRYFQTASVIMVDCNFTVYEYNEITQNVVSQFELTTDTVRNVCDIYYYSVKKLLHQRRLTENFEGKKLKVATYNCTVHSQIGPKNTKGKPEWISGVEMTFFDILAKKLNFSYEIISPKGNDKIGSVDQKGEVHGGILGLVYDKEVDLGFCGLWFTAYRRMASVQLTSPTTDVCLKYLVPRPLPLNTTSFGLFASLHWIVWIVIISVTIIVAIILKCFAYATHSISDEFKTPVLECFNSFELCLLIIWQTLCNNAPKVFINLGPLRHIITWWALLTGILSTFYSSSLSSHLTQPIFSKKMNSFEDLVTNDFYWMTNNTPVFHALFNMQEYWQSLWIQRNILGDYHKLCDHIKENKLRQAIFVVQFEGGIVIDQEFNCFEYLDKFEVMSNCFAKFHLGFILQENSPFNEVFSYYISIFRERGLFLKNYRDSFNEYYKNNKHASRVIDMSKLKIPKSKLSIVNIQAVMYILLIGLILSCLTFVFELIRIKRKNKIK